MKTLPTALAAAALLLAGCTGIPVPEDKKDFIGNWQAAGVLLMIAPDGSVSYKKTSGGTTEINAPIKAWEGNNFVVGALGITTTFEVSQPPHKDGERWKMTVDGIELTRQQ